jgi:uncharacterized protein YdeI (YjbR/CyaY-like superfamily)
MKHYDNVEDILKDSKWEKELTELRELILKTELSETIKWSQPTYTINNLNVVLIYGTKDYFGIAFFDGAILNDPNNILLSQTPKVQRERLIKLSSIDEIHENKEIINSFLIEAIENAKQGITAPYDRTSPIEICEELESKFNEVIGLEEAFFGLTRGRQKAYSLFFSGAKKTETRTSRIEKWIPHILEHKGMNDR